AKATPEEVPQQLPTRLLADSTDHLRPVGQAGVLDQAPDRAGGAQLGVQRPEYQALEPRLRDRPGAHGAGLQGHVEGAAEEAPAPQTARGLAHRVELGVAGRV